MNRYVLQHDDGSYLGVAKQSTRYISEAQTFDDAELEAMADDLDDEVVEV